MNLPNWLSLSRLIAAPFVVAALVLGYRSIALGFIIYAALSDFLDGFFARRLHEKTQLGLFLDPLCDKVFFGLVFITMAVLYNVPIWLVGLVVVKDVTIGLFVLYEYRRYKNLKGKSLWISKATTGILFAVLIAFLVDFSYRYYLVPAGGFFVVVSGLAYILRWRKMVKLHEKKRRR